MELKDIKASCETRITLMQETLQSWGVPDDTLEPMEEEHLKVAWDEYNRAADPYLQDIRHLEQHWLLADITESLRTIAAGTIQPLEIDQGMGMDRLNEHEETINSFIQDMDMLRGKQRESERRISALEPDPFLPAYSELCKSVAALEQGMVVNSLITVDEVRSLDARLKALEQRCTDLAAQNTQREEYARALYTRIEGVARTLRLVTEKVDLGF